LRNRLQKNANIRPVFGKFLQLADAQSASR
jgi:hypothetical protein